jgi:uncharacterized protein (DUF1501 family)
MSCEEKRSLDRRSFLKGTAAAAALPLLFSRASFAGAGASAGVAGQKGRILVLVRLDGGNDGLNTVIPHGDDLYYKARPGLGIAAKNLLKLNDHLGLHPALKPLGTAWDAGQLGVLQGVGYPSPNRSHFTSSDIWHTGSTSAPERWSGWLGRALDRVAQDDVPGLQLDPGPLNLALVGEKVVVPGIADASTFRVNAKRVGLLRAMSRRKRTNTVAEYIRRSAEQAYRTSARVEVALRDAAGRGSYPQTELANRLWQVARLIEADMPSRVYSVRLSGFDTHSRQGDAHAALLTELGGALAAFQADLGKMGQSDRVLTVTYSEFGRRVRENRSLGTDHGAAAPMFVMGGKVRGGIFGKHPDLGDLDRGDLRFHTDFRQVYATVLDDWLDADSRAVIGERFDAVRFLA